MSNEEATTKPDGGASASTAELGACEIPLVEKLRSVPKDYRTVVAIQWAEDGTETGHRFIPVGYMMHEAAGEIEALRKQNAKNEDDATRYRWLRAQHWSEAPVCVVARPKDAVKLGYDCPSLDRLDAMLDDAMKTPNA